ncbi:MAG: T9SS type A sorting domain-containing protein [Bacteroidetes bacterium]|nr:T9SS type A sorting domain-containing protein [Bacteroidota bacterium]
MLKLTHNPFQFVLFSFLLPLVVSTTEVSAQFDSIIFARDDIYQPNAVLYMGDQNDDGCDDFVLITASTSNWNAKALLFHGGNPVDSVPVFEIPFTGFIPYHVSACDYNRDGYRDLIVTTFNTRPLTLKIYLGGPTMDTIPDLIFQAPEQIIGNLRFVGGDWPVDFNGDGYEEMVAYAYDMYGGKGAFLIYNSSPEMDSIPDKIATFYPNEAIEGSYITSGDLDGDGRTDLTFTLTSPSIPLNFALRRFVFGRSDFSFQDTVSFLDSVDIVDFNHIIQDINKDGKADLVINDTKYKYPYWYQMAVSYGSRNIDYIPEEGFNTQNQGWYYTRSVGDVNGDGYGDFLSSLYGSGGRLFVGGKHKSDDTPIRYYGNSFNILGRVGDVNGDGLDDIGIGTNGATYAQPGTFYIMSGERVAMAIEDGELATEQKEEITLKAYPNPTRGELSVEITSNYPGYAELRLYNTTGKELIKKGIELAAGITTEKINLRELNISSGVYIIDMLFKSTESETKGSANMNLNGKKKSVKIVMIK